MYIEFKDCNVKRFSHKDGWTTLVKDGDLEVGVTIEEGQVKRGAYFDAPYSGTMGVYNRDGFNILPLPVDEFFRKFRAGKLFLH